MKIIQNKRKLSVRDIGKKVNTSMVQRELRIDITYKLIKNKDANSRKLLRIHQQPKKPSMDDETYCKLDFQTLPRPQSTDLSRTPAN